MTAKKRVRVKGFGLAAFACAAVMVAVSCAAPSAGRVSNASVHGLREKSYRSLNELWGDSTLVVAATARGSKPVFLGNKGSEVPFTETTVDVDSVIASRTVDTPEEIPVRQLGNTAVADADGPPLLVEGDHYVLFLAADMSTQGSGWYVTGGGAGLFESVGGLDELRRLDPVSEGLPNSITLDDVERATRG